MIWSVALAAGLGAVTLIGVSDLGGPDPVVVGAGPRGRLPSSAMLVTIVRGLRRPDPFLDPRLFRSLTFSSAALVSLLTGFAFATAIIGGAVFVDRVLYGGPDDQRLALGALAAATAVGALVSGLRGPGPVPAARDPRRAAAQRGRARPDVELVARRWRSPRSRPCSAPSGSASG